MFEGNRRNLPRFTS